MKFNELSDMMQKSEPKPDTYEAGMALNQLLKIGTHAIKIHNMIDDAAEMESWVAKKIDLASNYVKSVHGYTAGSKAGTYDDDGMSEGTDTPATDKEIKMAKGIAFDKRNKDNMSKATSTIEKVKKGLSQQPDVADALKTANEDAGFNVDAWSTEKVKEFGPDLMLLTKGKPIEMPGYDSYGMELDDGRPDDDEGNVAADDSIGGEVTNAIRGHRDSLENSKFSMADYDRVKPNAATIKYAQNIINSPEFKKAYNSTESVSEDTGEGHMSKSQLYQTAKMAIELLDMIRKGDDLEGWVQTKLNLAADYLQAVYHYEDYQKLNPYREELDGALMQRHAGIIQKHLDEILERKCRAEDVDTKPGMMRILKKRVNEVEKDIAKENRKNTDEGGMPASVIKSKQRYANMSDEELADRFKGADEKTLRQMAWRHGYGNMSSHYLDRVKNVMTGKKTAKKEAEISEDPQAVGRSLAMLNYGKEMATAIINGGDPIDVKSKAQAYMGGVDRAIKELDMMYKTHTTESELEEGIKDWAKNLAMAGIIVAGMAGVNSINNAIDNSIPAVKAMNTALEMAQDSGNTELAKMIEKDLSDAKVRLSSGKDLSHVADMQDKYAKFMKTEGMAYESKLAVNLKQRLK
jgi:hypothetical protein